MEKIKNIISKVPIHNKKFLISAVVVVLLVILSIGMLMARSTINKKSKESQLPQSEIVKKKPFFASLNFSENELNTNAQKIQSVSIIMDAGANSLGNVTFSVRYDPSAISDVNLIQELDNTSALSNSLSVSENFSDRDKGISTMSLSLKQNALEQNGRGKIAKFSFKTVPGFKGDSKIEFTNIQIGSNKLGKDEEFMPQINTLIIHQR